MKSPGDLVVASCEHFSPQSNIDINLTEKKWNWCRKNRISFYGNTPKGEPAIVVSLFPGMSYSYDDHTSQNAHDVIVYLLTPQAVGWDNLRNYREDPTP